MTTRYDLVVAREGREGKTYFSKIGAAFPTRAGDGFVLSFDALPITNKDGECRVMMRPPFEKDASPPRGRPDAVAGKQAVPAIDDDIPF